MYSIHIIGKGKLGRSISYLLNQADIAHQLLGKQEQYDCDGLVYLCVPESQIATVSRKINTCGIVLHSAGSMGPEILAPHPICGVLHPIMSFSHPEIAIPSYPIPATICGDFPKWAREIIEDFATKIRFSLYPYNGSRRLYHAAAVISGNFATLLLHAGAKILEKEGVDYQNALNMLQPLAAQSIRNANKGALSQVLSGPLARGEHQVIHKQRLELEDDFPELSSLMQNCIDIHRTLSDKNDF